MMIHQSDASTLKSSGVIDVLPAINVPWVTQTLQSTHKSIFLKKSFSHLCYSSTHLHIKTWASPGKTYAPVFFYHECSQTAAEKLLLFQLLLPWYQILFLPWTVCPFLIYMGFADSQILVLAVRSILLIFLLLIFQMNTPVLHYRIFLQTQWRYWNYSQGRSYKGVLS